MGGDVLATDEHRFEGGGATLALGLALHHVQGLHERVETVARVGA